MTTATATDYRPAIIEILSEHTRAGEDLVESVLAGSQGPISADEALQHALWLDTRADDAWGADQRHHRIAREIRDAVAKAVCRGTEE